MASGYIVEQKEVQIDNKTEIYGYEILYYVDGLSKPRGITSVFIESEYYDYPVITSGLDLPIVIENDIPKVTHFNQLTLEQKTIIGEIKIFDFATPNLVNLTKAFRKIGRLKQIEILLSEF